jgi:hydrogenase-4 component F
VIVGVIVAPVAAAILAMPFRPLQIRRYVRLTLVTIAALLPLSLIGSVNGLSLLFVGIVSVLSYCATVFSTGMYSFDWGVGDVVWSRKSVYFLLLGAFWSAMLLVVLSTNFGVMWLGVSMTTLATAFLVGFSGEREALEAAWKYLVLCSVGLGFALLGILMLARLAKTLDWSDFGTHPSTPLARIAVGLLILGFATKAGLVPMHAWLPDAHSKAPAPISALLSGVLVSCSLYAIMRVTNVAFAYGESALLQHMLLALGAASAVVAGALMLVQYDLKRMLAYSTIEHAGLVALAIGFGGPLGFFAALFHIVNHAAAKSAAFLSAGMVQRERETTALRHLHGLWESGPAGRTLLGALMALCGLPPFGLFVSELLLIGAGISAHQWLPLAVGLLGMTLAFVALARTAIEIEAGRDHNKRPQGATIPRLSIGATTCVLAGALVLAISPWTPAGDLFQSVVQSIARF